MGLCCSNNSGDKTKKKKTEPKRETIKETKKETKRKPDDLMASTPVSKIPKSEKKNDKLSERLTELKAAILIQKWFRLWLAKLTVRRQLVWRIFQKVEYYGERNQMRLNRFFRLLIEEFSRDSSKSKTALFGEIALKPSPSMFDDITDLVEIPPEVEVNISPPFSVENLNMLMNFFKRGGILHCACVMNLLVMTTEKLKTKSNFNEVSTSVTNKITIVGDLHGNLDDLLTIFYKNDIPSLSNPYVFNGDIVDRGRNSIEVAMILCYCFLLFPNHVNLNRGNHEDPNLNEKYGFVKEIINKYRTDNKRIFTLFKGLFRQLPLGTIIDHKIFVVHGGISDIIDLNILSDIQRWMYHSIIKPPRRVAQNQIEEWEQVVDILWSDPNIEDGCVENEFRGGGKCFGPDVTKKFLKDNKFELLIRSHECKPEGYEYEHAGKVLTIFSSSNYYHPGSNKGAYIIYTGDIKTLRFVQFLSNERALKNIKFKDKVTSMEEKAISDLKRMLFTNRGLLLKKFSEKDIARTGKLTMEDYGNILSEVLVIDLPWRLVQSQISTRDPNNLIIYATTFNHRKEIQDESASDILYSNLEVLETIFRAIDKDNSGLITMSEFSDAMSILQKHSDLDIVSGDITELGQLIDLDNDGFIDINEFFEAFKISRT